MHVWRLGQLDLKVLYSTGETAWEKFCDLKEDHPRMTAQCIVLNRVSRSKRGGDWILSLEKKVVRDMDRAVRCIIRLYDFYLDTDDTIKKICRTKKRKKKFMPLNVPVYKYGIQVPRNAAQALKLDGENENHKWKEGMDLEVESLIKMDCFQSKPA